MTHSPHARGSGPDAPTNETADVASAGRIEEQGTTDDTNSAASTAVAEANEAFTTLRATLALRGFALRLVSDGEGGTAYMVRWLMTRTLPAMTAVRAFVARGGVVGNATKSFRSAIVATLGHAPEVIEPGRLHRFGTSERRSGDAGWCKLFDDLRGGVFGCCRYGISETWNVADLATMTPEARPASDGAPGSPHTGGIEDQQTHADSRTAGDTRKAFATLRAELAIAGYGVSRSSADDGPLSFCASRWGRVRELRDLAAVIAIAEQVGVRNG